MLGFRNMFRTTKPRTFNLQPRYYDERKERLDKLKQKHEKKEGEFDKKLYREHLQESWSRSSSVQTNNGQLVRFLIILLVIVFVVYYLLDIDFTAFLNGK